jgi:hypothetical protein
MKKNKEQNYNWQNDPQLRRAMIKTLRSDCEKCGYEQNYKGSGLCYQCWVDRDSPSQEELEKRL